MRSLLLASAIATVALAAVPVGVASAASPQAETVVRVELDLPASNGLYAHLETSEDETVTLRIWREGSEVTYETPGEVTEAGLKVRFGGLGLIDVTFTPIEILSSTEPGEGCTGAPRTLREGIFTGTIDFTGEREYVRLEGPQAEGSMSVISHWQCIGGEGPMPFAGASRLLGRSSAGKKESASLHVESRGCLCFFGAGVHYGKKRGASIFYGAKVERREGMEIARVTSAPGRPSAFVFDHEEGTATLRPPPPFKGRATFERRPHARNLWRSTIRVPLLGAEPLRTDGPGFQASLYPEYHFD